MKYADEKSEKIMKRLDFDYETVEDLGYTPVGVFLYGSQNYEMDVPDSDIDTRAVVFPKFEDLYKCNEVAKVLPREAEMGSGHLNITDVRVWLKSLSKGHINFLETLFSRYSIINETYGYQWDDLQKRRERIVRCDESAVLNAYEGLAYNAFKHLFSKEHYNPKYLATLMRINESLQVFVYNKASYEECLVVPHLETIKNVRLGKPQFTLEEIRQIAHDIMEKIHATKEQGLLFARNDEQTKIYLNKWGRNLLQDYMREEM